LTPTTVVSHGQEALRCSGAIVPRSRILFVISELENTFPTARAVYLISGSSWREHRIERLYSLHILPAILSLLLRMPSLLYVFNSLFALLSTNSEQVDHVRRIHVTANTTMKNRVFINFSIGRSRSPHASNLQPPIDRTLQSAYCRRYSR
jgi:hypothetical protein